MKENNNLTEETDNKKETVSGDMPTESNQPETLPKKSKIKLLPAFVNFQFFNQFPVKTVFGEIIRFAGIAGSERNG